jgi:phosphoglycerate kinase
MLRADEVLESCQRVCTGAAGILCAGKGEADCDACGGAGVAGSINACTAIEYIIAQAALDKAKARGVKILIPVDAVITDAFDFDAKKLGAIRTTGVNENIPDGWEGVDIGPESVKLFSAEIASAKTVIWNGPMGVFEIKEASKGTFDMAHAIAANSSATTIIGGGDSVKAVKKAGVGDKVTFISTGGGASLELLEGKVLPGVACLLDK